jgi:hypothetical protein
MTVGGRLVKAKVMRIPRLIVLHTILSTFAMAFAEIVKRSENSVDPVSPCEEWSNPVAFYSRRSRRKYTSAICRQRSLAQ